MTDADRIADGLPVTDAAAAADIVDPGDVVLVSGFGGVGYPKRVPKAVADDDRDPSLTIISGGGVGAEIADARVVDDGDLLTSGGATSGLDLAFPLVRREFGDEIADAVAKRMEYEPRGPVHRSESANDGTGARVREDTGQ